MKGIFVHICMLLAVCFLCTIPAIAAETASSEYSKTMLWDDYNYGRIVVRGINIYNGEDEVVKIIEIMRTQSKQFSAHIYPINASGKRVRWHSSDNDIATVDESGMVTGIAEGTARIYAVSRDSGRQDVITIKIIPYVRYPDSISIVPPGDAIYETGSKIEFNAVFSPDDTTVKDLRWFVYGNCATINQNGTITIFDKGTAIVKAYTADWKLSAEYTFEAIFRAEHFTLIGEGYNVKSSRPIIITFDQAVNTYFARNNIFATADETGNTELIDISVSIIDKQVVVTPVNGWSTEGCYIFIKENICDVYGNRLGKNLKYKIVNVRSDKIENG